MRTQQRINFWSSPRNISTALMYSFAQRSDMAVVDEPLYAHYLCHQPTAADHPGKADILASQEQDGERVTRWMRNHDFDRPAVLFKQMTHHLVALDQGFLHQMSNVLLIRDPRAILASFSKVVSEVTAVDIGLPQQLTLFRNLCQAGKTPAVIDAGLLLQDPAGVLQRLCAYLALPWEPQMLHWPPGPRPEDGVWASYWYKNVHQSTGFQPYQKKTYPLSEALESIAIACAPLYQELRAAAL